MLKKENHLFYLEKCLAIAESAVASGNHPFGALIVYEDKVVTSSENQVVTLNDVTAHAELLLVQKAQKILSSLQLRNSTLYTSTEPCAMCSGAIYWSGIRKVVFGCSTKKLFNCVKHGLYISSSEIFQKSTDDIEVISFSKYSKFLKVHQDF